MDNVDSLNDNWCSPFDYQSQNGICHVEVIDEERKININYASQNLLARVFGSDLAQSVIEWRDKDEEPFLEYPYRNAPLRSLYELRYIKGGENLKPEQMEQVRRLFTVYGDGKLNINTVSKEVFDLIMTAYNLENIREDIWSVRENGMFFTSLDNNYVAQLVYGESFDSLSEGVKNSIQKLKNYFKVNSGYFRIYLVAETNKGTKKETLVVVERKGGFSILNWKENFWTQ
jgi:type II secretory pathway component PulK